MNQSWRDDPRKLCFMEWLCTPSSERDPPTRLQLAAEIGVSNRTLGNWMSQRDFREAWAEEARNVIGSPKRQAKVLETLYHTATDPTNKQHVVAAKLYLQVTNALIPRVEPTTVDPTKLTDEELQAFLTASEEASATESLDDSVEPADGG